MLDPTGTYRRPREESRQKRRQDCLDPTGQY
ncbi:peptide tarsal-less AA [Drosophila biarmipes]|nr:peptide tarsal-less AA [Drosophila biarmipes]